MSRPEILVLIGICVIVLFVGITYFFHGRKIEKKAREEKKKAKAELKKAVVENKEPEQKPVPVGIIKQETKSNDSVEEFEMAPFRDKPQPKVSEKKDGSKDLKEEIKSLSPDMKKVMMTDLLKPKF